MKLGFNEANDRFCKNHSVMMDLELCEKYGFDCIDIQSECLNRDLEAGKITLEEMGAWFQSHHLKMLSYNALCFFNMKQTQEEKNAVMAELDEIIRRRPFANQGTGVTAQPGQFGKQRLAIHRQSGLGATPDVIETLASPVARLLVFYPVIERLALEGPLPLAIVTDDNAVVARSGIAPGCQQGRPVGGTWAVTHTFAAASHILVEGVQRHAAGTDQHAVTQLGHLRPVKPASGAGREQQGSRCQAHGKQRLGEWEVHERLL